MSDSDSTFKNWPADLVKAYSTLPLPSLYDYLLANEKMANELRLNSKELKRVYDALQDLRGEVQNMEENLQIDVMDLTESGVPTEDEHEEAEEEEESGASDTGLEEEEDTYPAWEVDMMRQAHTLERHQWEDVFVATTEIIIHLLDQTRRTNDQVLEVIPKEQNEGRQLYKPIKSILCNHVDNIENVREQMMAHIKDLRIELIFPKQGENFSPDLHRKVEGKDVISPFSANQIAKVIRIGYKRKGKLVRQADVSIYEE